MDRDSCFQLGYIARPHGLKGEVKVNIESDDPSRYKKLESVLVELDHQLIPFFIDSIKPSGRFFIYKLEDVDTLESAEDLVGSNLWLPLDLLPQLEEGEFYYHEIIGYSAFNGEEELGEIKNYYSSGPQHLLSVENNGHELLIPVVKDFIVILDRENQRIIFELPEGLTDL